MHLFIVSDVTLPVALRYWFAGTTRKQVVDWADAERLHPSAELAQAWLYADICGVHEGDELLFYLEKPANDSKREGGRFFGLFRCASKSPFLEHDGTYLHDELDMPVFYRILVEPLNVYAKGLTEWEMMDEMGQFRDVHDVPWTVIYRKMRAGRGCTPLLPHEAEIARKMLDLKNAGQRLPPASIGYSSEKIALCSGGDHVPYAGDLTHVPDIGQRAIALVRHPTRSAEMHVQAYLMQELRRDEALTRRLFPGVQVDWIGNEIYCGAGMQRMDIVAYSSNDLNAFVHVLELKARGADAATAAQLNRYVKWLRAHVPGITPQQIVPTVVCPQSGQAFHDELKTYLRGHGIVSYRELTYDADLEFELLIHDV